MKKVDVAIIGAGLAGIFAAYELVVQRPDLEVLLLEQGEPIRSRNCPILQGKVGTCVHCKTCAVMRGFGGAGAFWTANSIDDGIRRLVDGLSRFQNCAVAYLRR